ncbi:MAG: FAD binding domain-containing protein [Caldimonas sp.]
MSLPFERPRSIAEATQLLAAGPRALLAGGTDLYPAHVGRPIAGPVLDLGAIAALRGIRRDDAGWRIGATTTWSDIIGAELPPLFDALKAAAREVGGVQIQNAGTVAGNLCNASPAADGTPVLMALGASVVLASERGERELPVERFVLGSRRTACAADEFVVAVRVPARGPGTRSAFIKLGGRRYLTISMTMVAVVLDAERGYAGIAVGSCSATARRLPTLEAKLVAVDAPADLGACMEDSDLAPLAPIDDLRASAAYRRDATLTLLRRALRSLQT